MADDNDFFTKSSRLRSKRERGDRKHGHIAEAPKPKLVTLTIIEADEVTYQKSFVIGYERLG